MEKIHISNRHEKVLENFDIYEFYIASNPDHEFDYPLALIKAAQILRNWVGFSLIISSTSRPMDNIDGKPFGFHRLDLACDYITPEMIHGLPAPILPEQVLINFKNELIKHINGEFSQLILDLREVGINGFGIELSCIHLDCRDNTFNHTDKYGKYEIFEFKCHWIDGKMVIDINRGL